MAMPARVSLCTITRNRPLLLRVLAGCILRQEYPLDRLEWVIVDDSDVASAPDLTEIQASAVSVKHIQLPQRLPIGSKRNLCHEHASAELLVLLDDDDYYPPSRVREAVAALEEDGVLVAGCDRLPLLLLPDGKAWMTPPFGAGHATANTLAYRRAYLDLGHQFDPESTEAEEASFLNQFRSPLRQLNPQRTVTWIGHGGNTVDKRLWIARIGEQRFEKLEPTNPGWPPQEFITAYCEALGLAQPETTPDEEKQRTSTTLRQWRIAVVTPYHNESVQLLTRCHQSVLEQELACTHVLVADGVGLAELDGWSSRHIRLGVGHDDNGNTPRALGALAAMNEGFDCIAFLDADNWFSADHLSRAIATQAATGCSVVFSDRHIVFPNGQRVTEQPIEDRQRRHVDTSCMVLFAPAFSSLALWAQMPRLFAPQCDRVMFSHLMATQHCVWSGSTTVYFETWYANHFLAAGLIPPLNAKFLALHPAAAWEAAAEAFRQRSPMPVYAGAEGIGADKPRIQLVSILGPQRSGGTLLQYTLCQHLGFQGIAEHQSLHHLVEQAGKDHRLRHSADQVKHWLREGSRDALDLKPFDREGYAKEITWRQDRQYTLLEAYFRVVQDLLPESANRFSKAYGQITVLDRSCSHSLVADVLYRCLPEHRAMLILRDPIEQITSTLAMQSQFPNAWMDTESGKNLEKLCRIYLNSIARPLKAAPVGQLHVVLFEQLLMKPNAAKEQACRFLGIEPNIVVALESIELQEEHVVNNTQVEAYANMVERLPNQILGQEPWKLGCLKTSSKRVTSDSYKPSASDIPQWVKELMKPVQEALSALNDQGTIKQASLTYKKNHAVKGWEELQGLVECVVSGLQQHSKNTLRDEG